MNFSLSKIQTEMHDLETKENPTTVGFYLTYQPHSFLLNGDRYQQSPI
ncbi:hypothetical protein VCSRO136_3684 [Vibrio cholerae]|nr:hypothetical protein VCSRO136_3684 [Vibrio cholerae]